MLLKLSENTPLSSVWLFTYGLLVYYTTVSIDNSLNISNDLNHLINKLKSIKFKSFQLLMKIWLVDFFRLKELGTRCKTFTMQITI